MKIKAVNIWKYLFYQIAINPIFWILVIIGFIFYALFGWISIEKKRSEEDNKYYWHFNTRSPRYELSIVLTMVLASFINLYFWNINYAKTLSIYLIYKVFYLEIDNGYHRPGRDPIDEMTKRKGNTKRERILDLYWTIYMNHRTIWKKHRGIC